MKKISTKEIVRSVGMSDRPEYYSGRGARLSDLNGNMLYAIYQKIKKEIGTKQSDAFVTMVKKIKSLSATNFLNALYSLESNDWADMSFYESDISINPDVPKRDEATIVKSLFGGSQTNCDDTEEIRAQFLRKLGFEIGPKVRERDYDCR